MSEINRTINENAELSPRMRQDARENEAIPSRSASTGRMFVGYCLFEIPSNLLVGSPGLIAQSVCN